MHICKFAFRSCFRQRLQSFYYVLLKLLTTYDFCTKLYKPTGFVCLYYTLSDHQQKSTIFQTSGSANCGFGSPTFHFGTIVIRVLIRMAPPCLFNAEHFCSFSFLTVAYTCLPCKPICNTFKTFVSNISHYYETNVKRLAGLLLE